MFQILIEVWPALKPFLTDLAEATIPANPVNIIETTMEADMILYKNLIVITCAQQPKH